MRFSGVLAGLISAGLGLTASVFGQKPITITFVHTNDLHAHIDPTAIKGKTYGGYARHATLFNQIRKQEKNVVLLNAGDTFQGTLFFNVYEGLADLAVMNYLGYQAMTLGNHEFDKGPKPLIEFAKRAQFPLLACNLETDKEPELGKWIKPSTIIEVDKQKIGVVGLLTDTTPNISSPGDTVAFADHFKSAQKAVDALVAQGVNKIVLMSHIGYDEDKELIKKLRNVDIVIGGHSHTPLGTPPLDGWRPALGPYPTMAKDADGSDVYIIQAWEWGKVVGKLKVSFDAKGKIVKAIEAKPIVVDDTIAEDPKVIAMVDAFKKPIEAMANAPIGENSVAITDRFKVGMMIADSMLDATAKNGAVAGFMNPGGVRGNLEAGTVTYGQVSSITPFRNMLTLVDLTGAEIIQMINDIKGNLIPSRGVRFTVAGGGARDVFIAGEPLDVAKTYRIVVLNFMAGGGDNLITLKNATKKLDTGILDIDVFVDYIKRNSPLKAPEEIRVIK